MGKLLRLLPPFFFGILPHFAYAAIDNSPASDLAAAATSGLDIPWWVWVAIGLIALVGLGFWMAGWGSDPSEETYG